MGAGQRKSRPSLPPRTATPDACPMSPPSCTECPSPSCTARGGCKTCTECPSPKSSPARGETCTRARKHARPPVPRPSPLSKAHEAPLSGMHDETKLPGSFRVPGPTTRAPQAPRLLGTSVRALGRTSSDASALAARNPYSQPKTNVPALCSSPGLSTRLSPQRLSRNQTRGTPTVPKTLHRTSSDASALAARNPYSQPKFAQNFSQPKSNNLSPRLSPKSPKQTRGMPAVPKTTLQRTCSEASSVLTDSPSANGTPPAKPLHRTSSAGTSSSKKVREVPAQHRAVESKPRVISPLLQGDGCAKGGKVVKQRPGIHLPRTRSRSFDPFEEESDKDAMATQNKELFTETQTAWVDFLEGSEAGSMRDQAARNHPHHQSPATSAQSPATSARLGGVMGKLRRGPGSPWSPVLRKALTMDSKTRRSLKHHLGSSPASSIRALPLSPKPAERDTLTMDSKTRRSFEARRLQRDEPRCCSKLESRGSSPAVAVLPLSLKQAEQQDCQAGLQPGRRMLQGSPVRQPRARPLGSPSPSHSSSASELPPVAQSLRKTQTMDSAFVRSWMPRGSPLLARREAGNATPKRDRPTGKVSQREASPFRAKEKGRDVSRGRLPCQARRPCGTSWQGGGGNLIPTSAPQMAGCGTHPAGKTPPAGKSHPAGKPHSGDEPLGSDCPSPASCRPWRASLAKAGSLLRGSGSLRLRPGELDQMVIGTGGGGAAAAPPPDPACSAAKVRTGHAPRRAAPDSPCSPAHGATAESEGKKGQRREGGGQSGACEATPASCATGSFRRSFLWDRAKNLLDMLRGRGAPSSAPAPSSPDWQPKQQPASGPGALRPSGHALFSNSPMKSCRAPGERPLQARTQSPCKRAARSPLREPHSPGARERWAHVPQAGDDVSIATWHDSQSQGVPTSTRGSVSPLKAMPQISESSGRLGGSSSSSLESDVSSQLYTPGSCGEATPPPGAAGITPAAASHGPWSRGTTILGEEYREKRQQWRRRKQSGVGDLHSEDRNMVCDQPVLKGSLGAEQAEEVESRVRSSKKSKRSQAEPSESREFQHNLESFQEPSSLFGPRGGNRLRAVGDETLNLDQHSSAQSEALSLDCPFDSLCGEDTPWLAT